MKRIMLLFTVAALMAVMMVVLAGPASAQGGGSNPNPDPPGGSNLLAPPPPGGGTQPLTTEGTNQGLNINDLEDEDGDDAEDEDGDDAEDEDGENEETQNTEGTGGESGNNAASAYPACVDFLGIGFCTIEEVLYYCEVGTCWPVDASGQPNFQATPVTLTRRKKRAWSGPS